MGVRGEKKTSHFVPHVPWTLSGKNSHVLRTHRDRQRDPKQGAQDV